MTRAKAKESDISDDEIRDMALSAGFSLRPQPDGEMDLNPYVYEFARTLINRARGTMFHPDRHGRYFLVVKVDRRTGATVEYDVAGTTVDVVNRWQREMCLSSFPDLLEEITETPVMLAKVLVNNLDDNHSYLLVRGNELPEMGAAINALIDKRWASSNSNTTLLTREDMEQLSSRVER